MKLKVKFLIMIAIILGAVLIFGQNKAEAHERAIIIEGTPTANSLDNIPDTVELDIKESEIEKVPGLIMKKIIPELEKQGIITIPELEYEYSADDKYLVSVWFGDLNDEWTSWDMITGKEKIYKVYIRISEGYMSSTHLINREITIKYNNTQDYNEEDEKYMADLIKKHPYFKLYYREDDNKNALEKILEIINDPTITLVYDGCVAGDIGYSENGVLMFKNGVFYQRTRVYAYSYEEIYIGNNITVGGFLEWATVTVTPKENSTMRAEVTDLGYKEILGDYELTLVGAEKLDNPLDITFNLGANHNGKIACILHKKKDGTNEKIEQRIVDGKITITVDELSPFVIGAKEPEYLLGDVDGNGKIDAQDAVMILKYVAHNIELNEQQLLAANTTKDKDGTVDAQDAVQILKLVAHNITEF